MENGKTDNPFSAIGDISSFALKEFGGIMEKLNVLIKNPNVTPEARAMYEEISQFPKTMFSDVKSKTAGQMETHKERLKAMLKSTTGMKFTTEQEK